MMGREHVTRPDGHTPRNMPQVSRWEGWGRENKLGPFLCFSVSFLLCYIFFFMEENIYLKQQKNACRIRENY